MTNRLPARRRSVCGFRSQDLKRLGAALLLAGAGVASAAEPEADAGETRLHLSGFGTLGVMHADAPAGWGFQRDIGERNNGGGTRADIDSRLGVQANYRVSSQVELVGQLVGASRSPTLSNSSLVSLALASYAPTDDITLRAGRLPADYFLMADYRNVGFAYPFVRPPVEQYASVPYTFDGADITKSWRSESADWKLRAGVARGEIVNDRIGTVVTLRPAYSIVLFRDDGEGLSVKASLTRLQVRGGQPALKDLVAALQPFAALPVANVAADAQKYVQTFSFDGKPATYAAFGGAYDRGAWLASLELSYFNQSNANANVASWGIVGHRWGALTTYAGFSGIHTFGRDRPPQWEAALTPLLGAAGAAQAQQLGSFAYGLTAPSNAAQRTTTLGLRWDFSDRIALKLQWDHVRVDAHGGRYWSTLQSDAISANVGSATIDFVF